jgi:hypothetical protein
MLLSSFAVPGPVVVFWWRSQLLLSYAVRTSTHATSAGGVIFYLSLVDNIILYDPVNDKTIQVSSVLLLPTADCRVTTSMAFSSPMTFCADIRKQPTFAHAEASMRVTLSGFWKCVYPGHSCHGDLSLPKGRSYRLEVVFNMSNVVCMSRQMTAIISHFEASADRYRVPSISAAL